MTPSIRSLLHVAIDAGLVTDVSITLPDREAIDRQLATLKEQGWEIDETEQVRCEQHCGHSEWWSGQASWWDGERIMFVRFRSQSVHVGAEVAA